MLEIKNLKIHFTGQNRIGCAIDGIDLKMNANSTLGLVGESGCGKSLTGLSIMGLVPYPSGKIVDGEIVYTRNGLSVDLVRLGPKSKKMRSIRGKEISMIFQEPMTSLNPVHTIGKQIMEMFMLHQKMSTRQARQSAIEILHSVGIPMPKQRIDEYPHQLSGGMRQRVMIAMAISCNPYLLIADEPTTALDVTIQAQIIDLMDDLRSKFGTAILFITHDLGVVAQMADAVSVMYLGKIIESGPVRNIFKDPLHPYTKGLMRSVPNVSSKNNLLKPIQGTVPNIYNRPVGCVFETRCSQAWEKCKIMKPPVIELNPDHHVACWLYEN